jgi:signal transduction histidine kinase
VYHSLVPYRSIEDPAKLRRLLQSALLLQADLDLPSLLRHLVEEARAMTGARYAALGVLNDDRTALAQFLTTGLEPEEEQRIGPRPTGRGVLGLLITDPKPLRLADLGTHPESSGFPPNHPPMTSFLGVPIRVRGEVYGNLYLTDKIGWSEFTKDDEALVEALGLAAGIAIENARLHQRVQDAAVYEDRDRMARDLHDTVIQRLFAVGLSLQSMAASDVSAALSSRLEHAIAELDDTIRQVRSAIYELTSAPGSQGLRSSILELVRELNATVGFDIPVSFDGPVDTVVPTEIADHLFAVVRESVTNIGRHAQANHATVTLTVGDGMCHLEVYDNGVGVVSSSGDDKGFGLVNLQRRAEKLQGAFNLESPPGGGTRLVWEVPLKATSRPEAESSEEDSAEA